MATTKVPQPIVHKSIATENEWSSAVCRLVATACFLPAIICIIYLCYHLACQMPFDVNSPVHETNCTVIKSVVVSSFSGYQLDLQVSLSANNYTYHRSMRFAEIKHLGDAITTARMVEQIGSISCFYQLPGVYVVPNDPDIPAMKSRVLGWFLGFFIAFIIGFILCLILLVDAEPKKT